MKIVRLSAKNVKRLRAVEVKPDGNVVVVSGRNGQGKSSLLDSIAYALGGKGAICREPVRRGAESAEVVCDLGEIVVTRTFSQDGGGALTVQSKDGAKYDKPQTKLDDLIGRLSFDPLEFARMDAKEQAETLRALIGLDLSGITQERARLYQLRADVNRDGKALAARFDALPEPHAGVPGNEISVQEIVGRLDEANRSQLEARNVQAAYLAAEQDMKAAAELVSHLEEKLEQARKHHAEAFQAAKRLNTEAFDAGRAAIDPGPIKAELLQVEDVNRKIRENAARKAMEIELGAARVQSKSLTEQMDALEAQRESKIAAAQFPVPGLGFDAEGFVTMNGLPFDQASQAEQLRVSVSIGLALNPKLRVLLVRDASLLDSAALSLMGEMAAEHDAQLWLERVEEGGATVVIEDGSVVDQDQSDKEHQARMAVQA